MKERTGDLVDRKLTAQEEALLDEKLASGSQAHMASMVAALPNEEPTLEWRSELSARIYETSRARQRRNRLAWILRPAVGLAAGAALAFAFLMTQPEAPVRGGSSSESLEAQIAGAHREAVQMQEFWGSVRAEEDVLPAAAPAPAEYRWDETDLGTL